MAQSIFWRPAFQALGWTSHPENSGAPLLAGNATFINCSGRLLGAHVAFFDVMAKDITLTVPAGLQMPSPR